MKCCYDRPSTSYWNLKGRFSGHRRRVRVSVINGGIKCSVESFLIAPGKGKLSTPGAATVNVPIIRGDLISLTVAWNY